MDACDGSGDSALHTAVWRGHAACVALLLERGAAHSGGNAWGGTPLHLAAAQCGATGTLAALLARGADVGARDKVRDTLFCVGAALVRATTDMRLHVHCTVG